MSKEMIISSSAHETRVAILEDDQVAEIFIERERSRGVVGNVYKGRVSKVLPGMMNRMDGMYALSSGTALTLRRAGARPRGRHPPSSCRSSMQRRLSLQSPFSAPRSPASPPPRRSGRNVHARHRITAPANLPGDHRGRVRVRVVHPRAQVAVDRPRLEDTTPPMTPSTPS